MPMHCRVVRHLIMNSHPYIVPFVDFNHGARALSVHQNHVPGHAIG